MNWPGAEEEAAGSSGDITAAAAEAAQKAAQRAAGERWRMWMAPPSDAALEALDDVTNDEVEALGPQLADPEEKAALQKFTQAHTQMAQGYRKGFEAFQSLGFVASAGDSAGASDAAALALARSWFSRRSFSRRLSGLEGAAAAVVWLTRQRVARGTDRAVSLLTRSVGVRSIRLSPLDGRASIAKRSEGHGTLRPSSALNKTGGHPRSLLLASEGWELSG